MRAVVVALSAACVMLAMALAHAGNYGYDNYMSAGSGYYGSYSHSGSGYGKATRRRTVVVPYPVPVQQPAVGAGLPAAGLGVQSLIGLESESNQGGLFGSDGTGLLFLLFLIPLLFTSNTSSG